MIHLLSTLKYINQYFLVLILKIITSSFLVYQYYHDDPGDYVNKLNFKIEYFLTQICNTVLPNTLLIFTSKQFQDYPFPPRSEIGIIHWDHKQNWGHFLGNKLTKSSF